MRHSELSKNIFLFGIFLALLGLYLKLYLIEETKEYAKGRTTFSSLLQKRTELEIPTIVLCMRPSVIPSMAREYGYEHFFELGHNSKIKQLNISVWQMAEKIGYKLNRDFTVNLRGSIFNNSNYDLEQGNNDLNGVKVTVEQVATHRHGMCQVINFNTKTNFGKDKALTLTVKFHESVPEEDVPTKIDVIMTSKNGWYGVLVDDWPLIEVTKFAFDIGQVSH